MLNIHGHKGNANQNYIKFPLHSSPDGYHQEHKWAGGVAHMVECLLCKSKSLSSNHSATKKKKKLEKKRKKEHKQ
jgi:hypothetical protein